MNATMPAAYDPTTDLFAQVKSRTAGPASSLIEAAEALLNKVNTLEQFRDQLIDLYAASDPQHLAEIMARLEMLGNMSGRLDVGENGRG